MTGRRRLLFVSPVMPSRAGNGLAMRAGATLRALLRVYRVTLLVAPRYAPSVVPPPPDLLAGCERVVHLGAGQSLSRREQFDIVHLFRLAALPDAAPWLRFASERHLDLDDLESLSGQRLAALLRASGEREEARKHEAAAKAARLLEDDALVRFDRVYVCSEVDRQALLARKIAGAEIAVLPNSLPLPVTTPVPPPHTPFTLLFVGTLGYAPNADAIRYFGKDVLPRVQAGAARPVTLRVIGAGASSALRRLEPQAGVEIIGSVRDVAPWYRDAHVAIVPLRAGGGTRIKVLEAFALRRPVVTTTIGIEGIAASDGREVMIADDPATFATACLRLLHDPDLAEQMTRDAFALFSRGYTDDALASIVAALASASPPPEPRARGQSG